MALVSDVVNRALRLLNVIDINDATPPRLSENGIVALNAMVGRWEANGLAMGWTDVAAPDDPLPAPQEALKALAFNLAVDLAPEFAPPQGWNAISQTAKDSLAELRRDRLTEMPLVLKSDLPCSEAGGYWNIFCDEPYSRR